MKLYELVGQYAELLQHLEDPDYDPETLQDTLEGIEGELEDKADGYAKVMKNLEATGAAIEAEIARLSARKTRIDTQIKRLKAYLQNAMEVTGKTKFKTDLFSFTVQKNPPKVVLDVSPDMVPSEYLIPQDPKVDMAAIKDALKAGTVMNIAHLEQGQSLRIR